MMKFRIALRAACRPMMMALALAAGPLLAPAAVHAADTVQVEGVTATAWAVADAETGKVLASQELDKPAKIASVTKLMTALVVAELAAKDPSVLDEEITFSERAVKIYGTKTGLQAGERLRVRDALYGLMLPSGNDAGIMFAQYFSPRLAERDGTAGEPDSSQPFIAAMNRKAKELGMTETQYSASFNDGAGPDRKTSSPRDLLILARAAMANPLVSKVVGTVNHDAKARTADGAERTIVWQNTNKLLGRAGVTGIKTGMTPVAKFCLLAEIAVKGRRYHIVVLGSRTDADRYNDTLKILAAVTGNSVR